MNITYKITSIDKESNSITVVFTSNNKTLDPVNLQLSSMRFQSLDELKSEIARMGMYMFQSQPASSNPNVIDSIQVNANITVDVSELKPIPIDQIKIKIREVLVAEGLIK
jgi:hypothetical protein